VQFNYSRADEPWPQFPEELPCPQLHFRRGDHRRGPIEVLLNSTQYERGSFAWCHFKDEH
jgi:hypothetical protein